MRFYHPLKVHEQSIKDNPKATLISDAIMFVIDTILLVLINVLVINNYGFNPILILAWILLGSIGIWLISAIIRCAKNIKNKDK